MVRHYAPHLEMTDGDNLDILGTTTSLGLIGVTVEEIASSFYDIDPFADPKLLIEVGMVTRPLMQKWLRRSGTRGGSHRADLRDTLRAAQPSAPGIALNVESNHQAPAQQDQGAKRRGI